MVNTPAAKDKDSNTVIKLFNNSFLTIRRTIDLLNINEVNRSG